MIRITMPEPQPKQKLFLKAKKRHVGYGGSRGGGKSWSIRAKTLFLGLGYPGIRMLIVRKTYKELINNHVNQLMALLKGVASFNRTNMQFKFINGSVLDFAYCANDDDLDRLQGVEYDIIFIDEATQLTEHQMKLITACCRGVNSYPKRIYYTCNPGGPGHGYIKRIFIDKVYTDGENPNDYIFIQSGLRDNQALMRQDPEYINFLKALPPKQRKAWLDGDWDVYEGQFFEDFRDRPEHYSDRVNTHVIEPFEIPNGWEIYRSYDFGYAKPFSCGWYAIDYDGCAYRILERYGCTEEPNTGIRLTPEQQFAEIAEIERTHRWIKGKNIHGIADPSIWDQSRGESIAEVAMKYGIYFDPGDNARVPGWMQCHYRLQFDDNGFPMFYVFNTCKAFIRTIPLLVHSEKNPEDLDTEQEDHVADEWRYFCMSRPITPVATKVENVHLYDPLHQY